MDNKDNRRPSTMRNDARILLAITKEEHQLLVKLAAAHNTTVTELLRRQVRTLLATSLVPIINHHSSSDAVA